MPKPGPDENGIPGVLSLLLTILVVVVVYGVGILLVDPIIEKMLQ